MTKLRVLVACEESQAVTIAFRKLGHLAYSCDLVPCSGPRPDWHYQCDALDLIHRSGWDLIVAHPPCTYLTKAGAQLMYPNGHLDLCRFCEAMEAREFFMEFYNLKIPYCIENPVPLKCVALPQPSQYIEPYWFGHPFSKKTLLWLNELPPLWPTCEMAYHKPYTDSVSSPCNRSKTFSGVAAAMADQWSSFLLGS